MIRAFSILLLIVIVNSGYSQDNYVKLKLNTGVLGIEFFKAKGIFPVNGQLKKGGYFEGEFDSENFKNLKEAGIEFEILIDDLQAFYRDENRFSDKAVAFNSCFNRAKDYAQPAGVQYGSMGGFYTFSEAKAELDTMVMQFPGIISGKIQIGTSFQGREICYLKISDNPSVQENEPQVLYTAVHHSQEPASLQQIIYFMYFLLENYGTDPEVTYLINNTELYFIPVVNPDGYVYNEQQNPGGGGLHRKNRHTTMFSDGIDLNRNYATYFGYDELGSSSIGFHPWYRGNAAFSEPETQAMKSFLENHNVIIDVNWHSYGNMIIYPWNYQNNYTDDSLQFVLISESMSFQNNYRFGTVYETYGYQSNGDADDWGYGETGTKAKSLSITAEAGNADDGFWPQISRIMPICEGTIWTNLVIAHYAHAYYKLSDLESKLVNDQQGYFPFKIQSTGLDSSATFTLEFVPISSNISFPSPLIQFSSMGVMQKLTDSAAYILSASAGDEFSYEILVNNGLYTFRDTITKIYGNTTDVVYDDCESFQNWSGDDWNISAMQSFSGNHSISESPSGNYYLLQYSDLYLAPVIDLSSAQHAVVQFMMKYDLENNYDYIQVFASADSGTSWQPLCGRNSMVGTDDEDEGQPVYHGQNADWIFEESDLDDYLGQTIKLKFSFYSDQSETRDGFYFDNFKVVVMDSSMVSADPNNNLSKKLKAMPNPAHDEIRIESSMYNFRIEVYNVLGEIVFSSSCTGSTINISIGEWERGIYFYKVTGNLSEQGKFMVK